MSAHLLPLAARPGNQDRLRRRSGSTSGLVARRRPDPVRAEPQANAVHDWPLTARRFLLGLCRFLLEMLHSIWQVLVVLSLLLGWTVLSVAQRIPLTQNGLLAVLLVTLVLALIAGARLEVRLQGDLPIPVSLDPGGDGYFLLVENELGAPAQFSARVRSDPLPPQVQRDWAGLWQESQSAVEINVSARHRGVLDFVHGGLWVVAPATDERPRLMHGSITFPRSGPAQHSLNYPSTTRNDYETALTDEDVAGLSAVMAYVRINRVKPVHSTTCAFRITFVQRDASDERETLAYALDVQRIGDGA
jgi:hypothetical protein